MIKDCLEFESRGATIVSNSNEADRDDEINSDEENFAGCDDTEEEESDEDVSSDEMEDGNLDSGEGDGDNDDDDLLSF
jgi:hypothetical protein